MVVTWGLAGLCFVGIVVLMLWGPISDEQPTRSVDDVNGVGAGPLIDFGGSTPNGVTTVDAGAGTAVFCIDDGNGGCMSNIPNVIFTTATSGSQSATVDLSEYQNIIVNPILSGREQGAIADLRKYPWGSTAFTVLKEMRYDATQTIEALVSRALSPSELERMIAGKAQSLPIRVTSTMTATLTSNAFDIENHSSPIQAIPQDGSARWQWTITPKPAKYGLQKITLTLKARLKVDGSDADLDVETLQREIEIQITGLERAGGFIGTNWQWFATTLAAGTAWWIRRRYFPDKRASGEN